MLSISTLGQLTCKKMNIDSMRIRNYKLTSFVIIAKIKFRIMRNRSPITYMIRSYLEKKMLKLLDIYHMKINYGNLIVYGFFNS